MSDLLDDLICWQERADGSRRSHRSSAADRVWVVPDSVAGPSWPLWVAAGHSWAKQCREAWVIPEPLHLTWHGGEAWARAVPHDGGWLLVRL